MNFLEQVKSYQRALTRKSRFLSFIMMASGIGLVAAAPFLSYEVSKIECYEKGTMSSSIGDDEVVVLINDWKRKESEIDNLNKEIDKKDERITKLIEESDCDDVVEVIQNEKKELEEANDKLQEKKEEIEKEKDDCRKQLAECKKENEGKNCKKLEAEREKLIIERDRWKNQYQECKEQVINNTGNDECEKLAAERKKLILERDRWKNQYAECKEQIINNTGNGDCSKVELELEKCKARLGENHVTIKELREKIEISKSSSNVSIAGSFVYNEIFYFNNNSFEMKVNLQDDPDWRYALLHNGKDISNNVQSGTNKIYRFKDNNKSYELTLGKEGRTSTKFRLLSD